MRAPHALCLLAGVCFALGASPSGFEDAPPGCRWLRTSNSEEDILVQLSCTVPTVSSADNLLGNLTANQIQKIDAVKLTCTDLMFFESSLHLNASDLIGKLRRLKNLRIDMCKIRYVPALVLSPLRDLTDLTVRSYIDNISMSAMTMEFHEESFRGLTELRHLDLGYNNIWTFPPGVFCPLFTLKSLNLTGNHLQDISEIGFSDWGHGPTAPGKSCNTGLKILDVSHNSLASLPDTGLSSLRTLEVFNVQNNLLVEIQDRAFVGLTSLRVLNASSNRLVALPPELFLSSREIREIHLSNNLLSVLAPDLLKGLDQLLLVDLSQNKLTNSYVNRETFAGLVRLLRLNLSFNKLTRLDPRMFQDLRSLEELNLENNEIETISRGAFADLVKLKELSVSRNKLKIIEEFPFSNLFVLSDLYLDDNQLATIHPRAFENITYLKNLGLNGNKLSGVPQAIKKLRFLKSLDIGKNNISVVDNTSFEGLEELVGLRLVDNKIVNVSVDAFSTLPMLQVLNLATNRIERIEKGAFDLNPMVAVRLDGNRLTDIKGIFNGSNTIAWLNISDNLISRFEYDSLPATLEWLDIHKNRIPKFEGAYTPAHLTNLKWMDFSYNIITEVDENSVPDRIQDLFLNNNRITSIRPGTFLKKQNLRKVVLNANRMRIVEMFAFHITVVPRERELPQIYLADNPFLCDCKMEWMQNINFWNLIRQYPRFMDLESVTCQLVRGSGETMPILELPPTQFLCPYADFCDNRCYCCDYVACDCKMTCPNRCSCYHGSGWESNVIDCSSAGYTSIPDKIPMDATEIYLDGNNFASLGNHIFIGKKKLSVLFLNNSNIASIENDTFNGLYSLRTLHLGSNRITELKGHEFNQTKLLKELYMDHNAIGHVDNGTFASVTSLKSLHLEHNKIRDIDPEMFGSTHPNIGHVYLEGNSWTCNCDNINKLEAWMKANGEDLTKMFCLNGSKSFGNLTVAEVVDKCYGLIQTNTVPSENQSFAFREMDMGINYVPLFSIILIAVILLFLLGALIFSFRQDVRLWAHSKYGVRLFKNTAVNDCELDKDRLYDGYMVYSILDDDFVSRVISPELEQSGYSLCLHYRDLQISSDNYLSETLLNAMEASKRLILVVSFSFLQNEWSKPNFKKAMKTTIESIGVPLRRHKVVFILTTDVSALNLDADLQSFFKICTVVLWGEKRFWEKMRFAMPDIANLQWNKSPSKSSANQMLPNGRRGASTRYTASPTSLDQWYKYAALPPQPLPPVPTPGDDSSLLTSTTIASQQYDGDPLNHSYISIDTHCYERARREGRVLDDQGYLRPRPAPHPA